MIVVALVLSILLVSLDMTLVATAIPEITDEFHNLSQVGWYGSAFFLTVASFQSTWGKAYKYFPLKLTFLMTIAIFEIGGIIRGAARSSTVLITGRAVAGAGGACISSGAFTIIGFAAPPNVRPAYNIPALLPLLTAALVSLARFWAVFLPTSFPGDGVST